MTVPADMSTREVCEYLGMNRDTVRRLIGQGAIIGRHIFPDRKRPTWRIDRRSVEDYRRNTVRR